MFRGSGRSTLFVNVLAFGSSANLFNKISARFRASNYLSQFVSTGLSVQKRFVVTAANMDINIEQTYQKKTQLEHCLLRPDTYIGSVEFCTKTLMWVYDEEKAKIVQREISYVPGLYKIFDEILVNAADNKQRDHKMNVIRVNINKEKNEISVMNNGKGIPVVEHKVEKKYVPTLIFGTLLTSSNYNDDERKVTGGRNGFGAKLCNIFSKKFTLETSSKDYGRKFKQTWHKNMERADDPIIEKCSGEDFTRITFQPDLERFGMTELDDDLISLMCRRAVDLAGVTRGVKVYLNGNQIECQGFKQYIDRYLKDREDEAGEPLKIAYEHVSDRWEIGLTVSDKGFQQVSFVNSIATSKGGKHVDYVADQIVAKLIDTVKKKIGKNSIAIKPFQIKNHMWIFVNSLIENPSFDSQTKENMTLQQKNFGSTCDVSEKFIKEAHKCGIIEAIMSWVRFKQTEQQDKKCSSKKTTKLKGIPKLEDANDAGTKNSHLCTLILTEGDSAKTLAVAGLGVIGRDRYGVFPLRGKLLNVREGSHKQIMENVEINAMLKILGLQYRLKYASDDEFKTLRYGKVMIMADQDQDGSHIKGLVINFIHCNWPNLIKRNFVEEFITPIVKVTKGKEEQSFYSIPEYVEWRQQTENWKSYRIKYYKGLGTSSSKEAKEYFSDMLRHRIPFKYSGNPDDDAVDLAFSKKKIEERKDWLTKWMEIRKERREKNEIEDYLYNKDTREVTYSDFINKELVLFSNMDNERSIPCLVDGLKPGQRKVMFTCFKRADKKEVKVAQLAGAVGEMSAYHHGEQSLMMTIINLAQDYCGSNNINLLMPRGQFGTRLQGGKDSASPRYIFTQLNPVTKTLFQSADENVLRFLNEENQRIEPEWYCPIIPTILINGAEGIGTGWSTKVPNYNPRDVVENIRRLIRGDSTKTMKPWYRHFTGTISQLDDTRYVVSGEIATLSDDTLEITELPIKTWTQNYKENVLEPMLEGSGDKGSLINDFKEYHSEQTVKFIIKMAPEKLRAAEREGLHKIFKLQTVINTTSMVLFDANGCLRRFNNPEEICREFFDTRKQLYVERKRYMEGQLRAESKRLSEQARFILMKIENKIQIENKRRAAIIEQLVKLNFPPDPVAKWKELQRQKEMEKCGEAVGEEDDRPVLDEEDGEQTVAMPQSPERMALSKKVSEYDYLVGQKLWKLSTEEKDKLVDESDEKKAELKKLEAKTWSDLWEEDLSEFMKALEKHEAGEKKEMEECIAKTAKKLMKDTGRGTSKKPAFADLKPNPNGIRVPPTLDAMKEKYEPKAPKRPKKEGSTGENGEESKPKPKAKKPKVENGTDSSEKPKPTRKKKVVHSDSEDDDDEIDMYSDDEDDFDPIGSKPKPSSRPLRERAQNGVGAIENGDEDTPDTLSNGAVNGNGAGSDDDDVQMLDGDNDDDFKPEKPAKKEAKPKAAKPKASPKKKVDTKAKAKPKPAKKKKAISDDEESANSDDAFVAKAKSKPKTGKRKSAGSDSDESDFKLSKSKPKKAKAAKTSEGMDMRQFLSTKEDSPAPMMERKPTRPRKKIIIDSASEDSENNEDSDFQLEL